MRRPSWWEKLPAPQTAAWTVPTRELHYFEDPSQHNAMMLLYTDEPAASYWAPYIEEPSAHDRAQIGGSLELKRELVRLLLRRQREAAANKQLESGLAAGDNTDEALGILIEVVRAIPELKEEEVLEAFDDLPQVALNFLTNTNAFGADLWASVSDYAIRDWLQPPDGAGCHAWQPRIRSWEVRSRLRGFPIESAGSSAPCLHICGEAYSDYQGFIEGALRSAADAVASITGEDPPRSS